MHVFLGIKKKIRKDGCFSEITSLLNRAEATSYIYPLR